MLIATNDQSKKSPYIFDESSYDLHHRQTSLSQYDLTHKGLYMFNKYPIYLYGIYTVIIGGATYEQQDQIGFGNFNWVEFNSQSDIKAYMNGTAMTLNLQHNYSKLRIAPSSPSTLRIIAKYY